MIFTSSFLQPGLSYRFGVVGAGKTAALLSYYHELRSAAPKGAILLAKPSIDTRHGDLIASRNGLFAPPDFLIDEGEKACANLRAVCVGATAVLIDEAQFLAPAHVNVLRELARDSTSVVCYGLRTDFRGRVFPGSLRLFELSDRVEQIPATCRCGSATAAFNAHVAAGAEPETQVQIGGDELFLGACYACWSENRRQPQPAPLPTLPGLL